MEQLSRYCSVCVGPLQMRVRRRLLIVCVALLLALVGFGVVALMLGEYPLSISQTVQALVGTNTDPLAAYFVQQLRLPRVFGAVLVGACLGVAGGIFQALTRNPLGSPDITGFTVGAASGALLQIIVFDGGPVAISAGAVTGGFLTGVVVFALSRRGGVQGTTFVLIGLGISFVLQALNSLLIVKAELNAAQDAAVWLAGSLNGVTWPKVGFLAIAMVFLLPLAFAMSRGLSVMMAGDEIAAGVGVAVQRYRTLLIGVGVVLTAVAVAVTGPIGFVALAAPQLAKRLSANADAGLGVAALMGAVIVLVSDMLAQRLIAPAQLPVGTITGVVGGMYLIFVLFREWRGSKA